jgi:FAD/FMN-containing dehydrogenase
LLRPTDIDYHDARQVFNAMIDRHPALIARCVGAADVIACVRFAGEHDLPLSATAFAHRSAPYNFLMLGSWSSPAQTENGMRWVHEFWHAMGPSLEAGVYVNYLSGGEGDDRVRGAYGANYDRLLKIKQKYDPTNLFRINQNIRASQPVA